MRSCTLPSNIKVSNGSSSVAIGEEVSLYCTRGYKISNSLKLLPALCDCNGKWNITTNSSACEGVITVLFVKTMVKFSIRHNFIADYFCTSPPPPPTPGGVTSSEDDENRATFPVDKE